MIGGDEYFIVGGCEHAEQLGYGGVAEPAEGDAPICGLVACQLAYHLHLCTCMREHVDKVDDNNVKVVGV